MNVTFIKSKLCYRIELDITDEKQNNAHMTFCLIGWCDNTENSKHANEYIDIELVDMQHKIVNINILQNMIAAGKKYIRENLDIIIENAE